MTRGKGKGCGGPGNAQRPTQEGPVQHDTTEDEKAGRKGKWRLAGAEPFTTGQLTILGSGGFSKLKSIHNRILGGGNDSVKKRIQAELRREGQEVNEGVIPELSGEPGSLAGEPKVGDWDVKES